MVTRKDFIILLTVFYSILGAFVLRKLCWRFMASQDLTHFIRTSDDGSLMFNIFYFTVLLCYLVIVGAIYTYLLKPKK